MKKTIIYFWLIISSIFCVYTKEYLLFSGKTNKYNDLLKGFTDAEYAIKYDDEDDILYFQVPDWLDTAWIHLTWNDLSKFRKNIDKYFEWEKLAVKNKAELEKELPDSTIKTTVTWNRGDNWYKDKNFELSFRFFSQNPTYHQLVLYTSKATGSNRFVTYKIDGFYFDKSQLQQLLDATNETVLKAQIEKLKKEKEKEDLFN
ncbi:MAG: hypothetical protein IK015_04770 [Treponema sp.]|nr:hypothetical protein [Treponema sp.]